jgi:hypothetical protein
LAPLFFPTLLHENRQAVRRSNRDALRTSVNDLKIPVLFLPNRTRVLVRVALWTGGNFDRLDLAVGKVWSRDLSGADRAT